MRRPKRYQTKSSSIVGLVDAGKEVTVNPIEAMQLSGVGVIDMDIYRWVENYVGSFAPLTKYVPQEGVSVDSDTGFMLIATLKGVVHITPGDWVVRTPDGVFNLCKGEDFEDTYEFIKE